MVPSPVETWNGAPPTPQTRRPQFFSPHFCKDSCSMIPVPPQPCMWPCGQLITSPRKDSFFFFWKKNFLTYRRWDNERLRVFFFFLFLWSFYWQRLSKNDLHDLIRRKTVYRSPPSGYTTANLPRYKKTNKKQHRRQQFHDGTEFWTFHCDLIVSRSSFWYIYCVVESSWLFVLRSEHDNLQFIRVVKYFILRAGCLNLSNKKTKLLLYYLLLGKRFVKGLLTDTKIKKAKCMTCLDGQFLHRRVFLTVILTPFSTEISVTGRCFDSQFFDFLNFTFPF